LEIILWRVYFVYVQWRGGGGGDPGAVSRESFLVAVAGWVIGEIRSFGRLKRCHAYIGSIAIAATTTTTAVPSSWSSSVPSCLIMGLKRLFSPYNKKKKPSPGVGKGFI
jgi:hypothetical protein